LPPIGFTVERAPLRDSWFLFDAKGKPIVSERGTTAFLTAKALAELKKRKNRP
jgi:hypothetical protein